MQCLSRDYLLILFTSRSLAGESTPMSFSIGVFGFLTNTKASFDAVPGSPNHSLTLAPRRPPGSPEELTPWAGC